MVGANIPIRRRLPRGGAVGLLAAAGLAMPASAVANWLPSEALSSTGPMRMPAVAGNAAGDAAMAWVQGPWRTRSVVVAVRPAGRGWGQPVVVASGLSGPAIDPQIALDSRGGAVVAWRQAINGRTRGRTGAPVWVVRASTRGTGGLWSRVATLSPTRLKTGAPSLDIDAAGNAVVAWHWGTGTRAGTRGFVGEVQAAVLTDGRWSPGQTLSGVGACREERRARAAMSAGGHSVVWWQCDVRGGSTTFAVGRGPADEAWSGRRELPFRTQGDQLNDLALWSDGSLAAISGTRGGSVRWWRGQVSGAGVSVAALPGPGARERIDGAAGPRIAPLAAGDALTAWVMAPGRGRTAPVTSTLGAGAAVGLPGPPGGAQRAIHVAGIGDRRAVAAWIQQTRGGAAVVVALRASDGTWSEPRRVSATGGVVASTSPRVAGGGGVATVAWERVSGGVSRIERAEYRPSER